MQSHFWRLILQVQTPVFTTILTIGSSDINHNSFYSSLNISNIIRRAISEFVFEVLNSTNEVLVGSLFCLLLQLTENEAFYQRSHCVYGVEKMTFKNDWLGV